MDKTEPRFRRQQHILNCALAVAAVYTQFTVLLMATSASTERADWNDAETNICGVPLGTRGRQKLQRCHIQGCC